MPYYVSIKYLLPTKYPVGMYLYIYYLGDHHLHLLFRNLPTYLGIQSSRLSMQEGGSETREIFFSALSTSFEGFQETPQEGLTYSV